MSSASQNPNTAHLTQTQSAHLNPNTAHLIPIGVKYNSQGKIYMICFAYFVTNSRSIIYSRYIDVPPYKVEEYLDPAHNKFQSDVKYVKGGVVFPIRKIYELDEFGKPIKEVTTGCIPESLFATKEESGTPGLKFAPRATSAESLLMPLHNRLNDSNLILEHNVRYMTAEDAVSTCKAITVRSTASDANTCRLHLASAPNLQTIQMQGCGFIAIDAAPKLKNILLDLSHVWLPTKALFNSEYIYPSGGVAIKGLTRCSIKTEFISCIPYNTRPVDIRAITSWSKFGYTLDFSHSDNLKILIQDSTSVIALRTCSNVTIQVVNADIGHIVLQNCTNVTINITGDSNINHSIIQNCDNIKMSADDIDSIEVNNSKLALQGNVNYGCFTGGTKLILGKSSLVNKCTLDNKVTITPGEGTDFQAIRYLNTPKKPLLPASLYLLDTKQESSTGKQGGAVTIVVNKPIDLEDEIPSYSRSAGRFGVPLYELPHVLYIAPDVPIKDTLEQLFDNYIDFTIDDRFQTNPYIYVVCAPKSQKEVSDCLGEAFADKIKFMPANKFATGREWLKSEGITLPSNYPEF